MTRFDDDPGFFGELWADDYDSPGQPDPTDAVEFLAARAGTGRVLELAIGTGRVGLPLAGRGIPVEGVEGSAAMVEKLRAKPGGADLPVVVGDLADVPVPGPFSMVFLIFNTLFNLTDQERQVDCFRNVAAVLEPGGAFVLECPMPDPETLRDGVRALEVTDSSARIEVFTHDAARQRVHWQRIRFDADGVHLRPHQMRYCWPGEMDLMARAAGLELAERYADFTRRPFDGASPAHISVYRLPGS